MKTTRRIAISAAALIAIAMSGCVELETMSSDGTETDVRRQAVTVVPEFMITGTDSMPDSLFVSELGLTVSEIRLEPMWTTESLAYSTREAFVVNFDIASGETNRIEEALELPVAGRYLVSIRLEPRAGEGDEDPASFTLDGFVSGTRDGQLLDESMDGRPQPMPFDNTDTGNDNLSDQHAYPEEWTPFEYRSRRAVFFTFNDVPLEAGEQFLSFSFDVRDWALDVVEPISNAVNSSGTWVESVDATNQIDSSGKGGEALIRTGVVRSDRRPR